MRKLGGQWRRVSFDGPNGFSAAVTDIYRDWHHRRGIPNQRMLLDCFLLLDPWLTMRTGSVPFWLTFGTRGSLFSAHEYLDQVGDSDEMRLMLFSHGTDSIGLASIREWRELLGRANKVGSTLGVDHRAFPRDFAVFARAHRELARVRHRFPMPEEALSWSVVEGLLGQRADVGVASA